MEGAQKKKPWMRRHHRVVRDIAYLVLHRYTVRRYGIDIEKFSAQGERAYLILMNHQTAFDQFFVGMTFEGPVYYVASEDLFSNGFISTLLRWAVAPIPIKKQTSDISAVKNCIRVAKEGGTIAIAPEGNRTYSGRTGYMNPAIAALAKLIKLPIAFLRIEGGYGVHPRWSDAVRKGHMRCYVSRVMEPEEFKSLSKQELMEVIERELYADEGKADAQFDSDVRAEYLERAMYVCPWCGLSEFESRGNSIECKRCRRKVEYGKDKRLRGQGFDFPFEFVTGWYDYQEEFINRLDTGLYLDEPMYRDRAALYEVIVYRRKRRLKKDAELCLYGDRLVIDGKSCPFADITGISVLGRNKLNIYMGEKLWQLKGGKRFNALKYVNIYYRSKNQGRGDKDGKFLGL
jgi:1-acyl-sn-glycerol-3-phosphate acyltransferase